MKKSILSLFVGAFLCISPACGGEYPDHPVKVIAAASPGGLLDLAARVATGYLSQELGQPFVIANVAGGGGNVAINSALQSKHDGYTLLVATSPQITYNATKMKVRYKFEDFRVLGALAEQRIGIITQPDRPWNDLRDAFATARKEKRPLVAGVMNEEDKDIIMRIGKQENVQVSPVPQGGGSACLTAVMGGHVDIGAIGLIFVENALAGKVKALACESEKRFTRLPDVPTLKELGYNFSQETLFLLLGPADMPEEVAAKIEKTMAEIGLQPEYQEQIHGRLQLESTTTDASETRKTLDRIYQNVLTTYK